MKVITSAHARLLVTAAVSAVCFVAVPSPAMAAPLYGTVRATTQLTTDGNLRSTVGTYPPGARLGLACYIRAQSVTGFYSRWIGRDDIWWQVVGTQKYVPDVDIDTGMNGTGSMPACPTPSPNAPAASTYSLPFKGGTYVLVSQSHHTGPSHNNIWNMTAVDFAVPANTPVVASTSGTIAFEGWAGRSGNGGGGITVMQRVAGNDMCIQYAHLNRTIVNNGQQVSKGQIIGYSGTTGFRRYGAYGAHLHWAGTSCGSYGEGRSKFVVPTAEGGNYSRGATLVSRNGR
ncbi:MAG TPA: M23 family metallopeptidase [Candidatus Luteococcus avicola]|nr:M23 family metallopeptidase [Candidatus Luteococcus avicola]